MCIIQNYHKKKALQSDIKNKVWKLKEFDKNRPNKEVAIQFNVPGSTIATWNQPILNIVCRRECFWIFWTNCRGNYWQRWWKWRWRTRHTNRTYLKKWSWQGNQNFETVNSVHKGFRFWSFNLKADSHYQSGK